MKKISSNHLPMIFIIINIIYIFLGSIYVIGFKGYYSYFGLSMIGAFVINFLFSIIYTIILKKKKTYTLQLYDVLLFFLGMFSIVSTIFAINHKFALLGFRGRYEGLFAILYYFTLTYISSFIKKEEKVYIVWLILFTGFIQAMYAILQSNGSSLVSIYSMYRSTLIIGLVSNPNFFGSYMILCLGFTFGKFIDEEDFLYKILYSFLIIIFLFALFLCNTMSCIIALIIILFYSIVYSIIYKKYKKIIALVLFISFTLLFLHFTGKTKLLLDLEKTGNEVVEITRGNLDGSFGTKRIEVWKNTLKVVPKYLFHGAGIDNYYYIYGDKPLIIGHSFYDKAHNEYLQTLVTQGIFSLICYLLLYGIVLLRGVKRSYKDKELVYVLPVMAYLVQAFFNISVIEVAPIFFISLGLLIERKEKGELIYKKYIKRLLDIFLSIILLFMFLPFMILISLFIIVIDHMKPIFIQRRTGYLGKDFSIYKFSTMKNDTVTSFGLFLRNSSLDELPQLINILKGEMSFIGPRPWITSYYALFDKNQKRRVEVRPGIIGLAQVNGRNHISIFKKIYYDIEYVERMSFVLDIKILFKSFFSIVHWEKDGSESIIKKELRELRNYRNKKK